MVRYFVSKGGFFIDSVQTDSFINLCLFAGKRKRFVHFFFPLSSSSSVVGLPFGPGGNQRGVFALALVQGEWKVYVSGLLDREQQDYYLLNITASDGLYVAHTAVEVTVMDANDNSPICKQVREEDMKTCCILIPPPLSTHKKSKIYFI